MVGYDSFHGITVFKAQEICLTVELNKYDLVLDSKGTLSSHSTLGRWVSEPI